MAGFGFLTDEVLHAGQCAVEENAAPRLLTVRDSERECDIAVKLKGIDGNGGQSVFVLFR